MQITIEDKSSVKKILRIEIPENDVTREIDSAYNDLRKTAKIKGYRPGKIPRAVLERRFRKNVHADVTSKIIQESFLNAIREKNLDVVGAPRIDPPELNPTDAYRYEATVEIKPAIADIDFKGFELKKKKYKTDEAGMEKQLQSLRQHLAKMEKIEDIRPAREEDFILIDFEGFEGDRAFPHTPKTEGFTMRIGDGRILTEFDRHLIGMRAGETKTFEVAFPADYADKNIAGKNIRFQATLKEIRKQILPELNDEFAKTIGYETMDALKARIMDDTQSGYARRAEHELYEQVYQLLLCKTDFETPEVIVNYELESMIMPDIERAFARKEIAENELVAKKNELMEKYHDTGVQQARRRLVMEKIIEQEKIDLTKEEMDQGIAGIAAAMGQRPEDVRSFYQQNPERFDVFRQSLLEKKAMNIIIEHSTVTEVETETEPVGE